MTFVAAKRFGDRILMAADTMISDLTGSRPDVIPGRLKAVILDPKTTIAYAGLPDQGIDAVIQAKQLLSEGASISDMEQSLVAATREYGDKLEFLIASHGEGAALKRIWDGRISAPQHVACIGQRDLLSRLLEQEPHASRSVVPHEFEAETPFNFAFNKLFNGIYASDSVGGFGVKVTCSPYGHCYNPFGGSTSWGTIRGGQPLSEQQLADRRSGMTQWSYSISAPKLRGVGVLGAIVQDAGIGYIYAPFLQEKPIEWRFERPTDQSQNHRIMEEFHERIEEVSGRVGGGIEVTFPPPSERPPTEAEIQQVIAHASAASLPTAVRLDGDAVWVSCGTPRARQAVRIGFNNLDPDPVWVLTTTINRLNAEISEQLRQTEAYAPSKL